MNESPVVFPWKWKMDEIKTEEEKSNEE